jgi:hypothetical protein
MSKSTAQPPDELITWPRDCDPTAPTPRDRGQSSGRPGRPDRTRRVALRVAQQPGTHAGGQVRALIRVHRQRGCYFKMLTARAITRATVTSEIRDWASMVSFAHRESGMTSVGLKAVALVKERYK